MPNSDDRQRKVADLVNQVDNLMAEALKEDRLADVPDDSLGQLFASVLRLYAAKIESGDLMRCFPSGSGERKGEHRRDEYRNPAIDGDESERRLCFSRS